MGLLTSPAQRSVTLEQVQACNDSFWARVDRGEDRECWPWMKGRTGVGYGNFHLPLRISPTGDPLAIGAHRVAWMLANGALIPEGMVIDHLCRNRVCCNPSHLDPVPQRTNAERAGTIGRGFKTRSPRAYTSKLGVTTWRVRFRRSDGDGSWINGSMTFASEADAIEFIEANKWSPGTSEIPGYSAVPTLGSCAVQRDAVR